MVGKRDPYKGIKHSRQMAEIFKRKSGAHSVKLRYRRSKAKQELRDEIHLLLNNLTGGDNHDE